MLLDEESQKYLTINTSCGLFRYTRLAFGVASTPAVFQSTMEHNLRCFEGVVCYLDDIIVTVTTLSHHLSRLEDALRRL